MAALTPSVNLATPALDRPDRRHVRVMLLMGLVVILSLGDLYSTLTFSQSVGMVELNPVAAYLLSSGTTMPIVLFKLGSVGITLGLILKIRRHRSAEVGAWVLAMVMVALTCYWHHYAHALSDELVNASYQDMAQVMQAIAAAGAQQ